MFPCVLAALGWLVVLTNGQARADTRGAEDGGRRRRANVNRPRFGRSACTLSLALADRPKARWWWLRQRRRRRRRRGSRRASLKSSRASSRRAWAGRAGEPASIALAEAQRQASRRGVARLPSAVSLYRDRLDVTGRRIRGRGAFLAAGEGGLHLATHTFATSLLDPELRALFPAFRSCVTRVDKGNGFRSRHRSASHVATCVATARTRFAAVGRAPNFRRPPRARSFRGACQLEWAELSAVAESPLREPIGA